MLISESWLREYASPALTTGQLTEKLTLAGLEVAGTQVACAADAERLLIGEIVGVEAHPNADKLKLCRVNIARKKLWRVVCAANNAKVGVKAPLALPGCRIGDAVIGKNKIRGVASEGMLCSAAEIGLHQTSDGIMQLDADAPLGAPLAEYLQLGDKVFDLELTPNRGDCLSVAGVAREVAALTGAALKRPRVATIKNKSKARLSVKLAAPAACPRYIGRAVCGIQMHARTPDWMSERLRRSGLRAINPVVDVTNYVMLETGQPMHAFDLDKIQGGITVRMAKRGEKLKLLDASEVTLTPKHLVIADRAGAIALAGIMGGDSTAISDATQNIYFEAAFFAPAAVIGKARQFGMHTDASHRFERGVDFAGQLAATARATELLLQIAGGEAAPITHAQSRAHLPKRKAILLKQTDIARTLGATYPRARVTTLLKKLGLAVKSSAAGWRATPPSWRFDLLGAHDLVEEVGRCFGFDAIKVNMPQTHGRRGMRPETAMPVHRLTAPLVAHGFSEAITYSFVDAKFQGALLGQDGAVMLANPIADNMSAMRQSLWPGLLGALKNNFNRQQERVRLFEIGRVFAADPSRAPSAKPARGNTQSRGRSRAPKITFAHAEIEKIAGVMSGAAMPRQWGETPRAVDFFDAKGRVEQLLAHVEGKVRFERRAHPALHPGQSAAVCIAREIIGYVGKLHPNAQRLLDIDAPVFLFELEIAPLSRRALPKFRALSRYPSVRRDLAVVVAQSVDAQELLATVKNHAPHLVNLELFDIYAGAGVAKAKKSFALGLTFRSESGNLTAEQIEIFTAKIIAALKSKFGATLR